MTIAVDWDVKHQTQPTKQTNEMWRYGATTLHPNLLCEGPHYIDFPMPIILDIQKPNLYMSLMIIFINYNLRNLTKAPRIDQVQSLRIKYDKL